MKILEVLVNSYVLCMCVLTYSKQKKTPLGLQDFRLIAVLGRGPFGKASFVLYFFLFNFFLYFFHSYFCPPVSVCVRCMFDVCVLSFATKTVLPFSGVACGVEEVKHYVRYQSTEERGHRGQR